MTRTIAPPVRRTQRERREATVAKLIDATVAALGEVGYARTTVGEICARAGVSQGGMFRHFPTRLDLLIAAADEVRQRQFANFEAGLDGIGGDSITHGLALLRAACRAPINAAWYELLAAARTDPQLAERLAPLLADYHAQIAVFGRTLPVAASVPPALLDTLLFTLVHVFDGEAMVAGLHPQPEQDEVRLNLLAELVGALSVQRTAD